MARRPVERSPRVENTRIRPAVGATLGGAVLVAMVLGGLAGTPLAPGPVESAEANRGWGMELPPTSGWSLAY